ncbi:MAG: hypothetical protein U9O98_06715 [Asgard group archaeon]|nr:hypothetical protein [Asgard group archaeon]
MKRHQSGIKPKRIADVKEVVYSKKHWQILREKRQQAIELMKALADHSISTILYGSLPRGDVSASSDIDLFVPFQISSFLIETALNQKNYSIFARKIVQATPKHVVKAHIYLSEEICITFPLTSMREREFEFIQFGGSIDLAKLQQDERVPGVDKRLLFIEPTAKGHIQSPVVGKESIVAKKLDVRIGIVKERVRILTTRDKVGRTGVYLDLELAPHENIDEKFKELVDSDPIVRRRANE